MENIISYVSKKQSELKIKFSDFSKRPKLAIITMNKGNYSSDKFISGKIEDITNLNFEYTLIHLDKNSSTEHLKSQILSLNSDNDISGYIIVLPLPPQIDFTKIIESIDPSKDLDGFHPFSHYVPNTSNGIINYLKDQHYIFEGKNAVVIGRSNFVGKPIYQNLLKQNMNVTVLHSKTKEEDKYFFIEHADLIVVCVGKENVLNNKYKFKENCIVFDVGINFNSENNCMCGDCENDLKVLFQSPVPNGVGLLTRLSIMNNLAKAFVDQNK